MEVDGQRLKNDTVSKLCEPCKEGTVSTQADGYCIDCEEYMCKPCFQSHLKLKLCRNHVFGAKCGGIRQVSKKPETKCKKHTTEVLKYYCRNHDSVGCGDCLVFDHRKCKPEFIRDLAKNIEESFDLKNILKEVDKLEIFKAEIEVSLQKNRSDNTEFHDKAIHEIQKHRSEMNTWLDNVTSKIEAEEMKIWKENESALSRLDDWIKTTNDVIDKVRDEISTEKYTGENLFIRMIECKSEVNEFVTKYVPEIKSNLDIKPFAFEANQKLCVLTKSANLGIIRLDTTTKELKIDERERQSYSTLIKDASNIASSSLPANETEVVGTGYTCTLNSPEKCSTIEEHNTTQEAEQKETAIGQTQTVPVESHQLATKNTDVPNNHEYADALKPGEPISPGAKDEEMPLSLPENDSSQTTIPLASHQVAAVLGAIQHLPETFTTLNRWLRAIEQRSDGSKVLNKHMLKYIEQALQVQFNSATVGEDNSLELSESTLNTIFQYCKESFENHKQTDIANFESTFEDSTLKGNSRRQKHIYIVPDIVNDLFGQVKVTDDGSIIIHRNAIQRLEMICSDATFKGQPISFDPYAIETVSSNLKTLLACSRSIPSASHASPITEHIEAERKPDKPVQKRPKFNVEVVDPLPSGATKNFLSALNYKMEQLDMSLVDCTVQRLNEDDSGDGLLFVVCNNHSRLHSDIQNTLTGVQSARYGRIILLVVHCQKEKYPQALTALAQLKDTTDFKELRDVLDVAYDKNGGVRGIYDCDMNQRTFDVILEMSTKGHFREQEKIKEID